MLDHHSPQWGEQQGTEEGCRQQSQDDARWGRVGRGRDGVEWGERSGVGSGGDGKPWAGCVAQYVRRKAGTRQSEPPCEQAASPRPTSRTSPAPARLHPPEPPPHRACCTTHYPLLPPPLLLAMLPSNNPANNTARLPLGLRLAAWPSALSLKSPVKLHPRSVTRGVRLEPQFSVRPHFQHQGGCVALMRAG